MPDFTTDDFDETTAFLGDGDVLAGRYRLVRRLDGGVLGQVWLAEDTRQDDHTVSVKLLPTVLSRNARALQQLRERAESASALTHLGIVRLHAVELDAAWGDLAFLVTQHVEGRTLDALLYEAPQGLEPERVLAWAGQLAAAVDYAHDRDVLHRAIEPAAVVIGEDDRAHLSDFGVARTVKDAMAQAGAGGSAASTYLSPQQAEGECERADDIYSLAGTLYEALRGQPPFTTGDIGRQVKQVRPPSIPGVPRQINSALLAGLAKQREKRPASATLLARRLGGGGAAREARVAPERPATGRPRWVLPLVIVLALAAAAVGLWQSGLLTSDEPERQTAGGDGAADEPPTDPVDATDGPATDPVDDGDESARKDEDLAAAGRARADLASLCERLESQAGALAARADQAGETAERELLLAVLAGARPQLDGLGSALEKGDAESDPVEACRIFLEAARGKEDLFARIEAAERERQAERERTAAASAQEEEARGARGGVQEVLERLRGQRRDLEERARGAADDEERALLGRVLAYADERALGPAVRELEGALSTADELLERSAYVEAKQACDAVSVDAGELLRQVEARERQLRAERATARAERVVEEAVSVEQEIAEWFRKSGLPEPEDLGSAREELARGARLAREGRPDEGLPVVEAALARIRRAREEAGPRLEQARLTAVRVQRLAGIAKGQWEALAEQGAPDNPEAAAGRTAMEQGAKLLETRDFASARAAFEESERAFKRASKRGWGWFRAKKEEARKAHGRALEARERWNGVSPAFRAAEAATEEKLERAMVLAGKDLDRDAPGAHATLEDVVRGYDALVRKYGPKIIELPGTLLVMARIPRGTFTMGRARGGGGMSPPHKVTISRDFYLGIHEVTEAQWQALMGPIRAKDSRGADHPRTMVTWKEIEEFLAKLNAKVGQAGYRFDLPTEAQWEYACRAGSEQAFHFGDERDLLPRYAWFRDNSDRETHSVGTKQPNAFGLFDMHGNAVEWCRDGKRSYRDEPVTDPVGPDGRSRIHRGGGCQDYADRCGCAYRDDAKMNRKSTQFGFRVALVTR